MAIDGTGAFSAEHLNKHSYNPQLQKMTKDRNEAGLSEVIGFILLLGLVAAAFSVWMVYVVPVNGREDEIAQMNYVEEQFTDYKLMLDALWISRFINVNGQNPMYPVLNVTPMISSTTLRLSTGGTTQPGGLSFSLFKPIASTGILSIKNTTDTFNIESNNYDSSVNNGEFPINITALEYSSDNNYWIQQWYSYQLGGVFLSQDNGTTNRISPLISITNAANQSVVVNIVPVQVIGNESYSSNNPVRVDTRQRILPDYSISSSQYRNNKWVNLSITTTDNATAAMWLNLFKDIAVREQLNSTSAYKTGRSWGPGLKTVFINITGSNPSPLVSLYVQRAEFDVIFNMVAPEST